MKRFLIVPTLVLCALWQLQAPVTEPTAAAVPSPSPVATKTASITPLPIANQPKTKPVIVNTATNRKPVVKTNPATVLEAPVFPNELPVTPKPEPQLQSVTGYIEGHSARGTYQQMPCYYYPWQVTPGVCDPKEPWFKVEPEDILAAMLDDCDDAECIDFVQQMLVEALQVGLITNQPRHPDYDLPARMAADQLYRNYSLTVIARHDCGQQGLVFINDRCLPPGIYR